MSDISERLAVVLDKLPIAIELVSSSGRVLGKAGGKAGPLGEIVPSVDAREAARWSFTDKRGALIPRTHWASACALRGEINDAGLVGSFWQGEQHTVRVTCVPTLDPNSDVAVVSFLQFLDTPSRGADGSHQELEQRLIRDLASAVATSRQKQLVTS